MSSAGSFGCRLYSEHQWAGRPVAYRHALYAIASTTPMPLYEFRNAQVCHEAGAPAAASASFATATAGAYVVWNCIRNCECQVSSRPYVSTHTFDHRYTPGNEAQFGSFASGVPSSANVTQFAIGML